jgi:septum formation protein
MLYRDGTLLGKPASAAQARLGWQQMAGKSGQLYTGHCVIRLRDNMIVYRAADATCTTVNFGIPPATDLDAYVESGEPMAVAGGFTLDGLGGWFIEGVEGDPSAVIGIGLPLIRRLLEHAGLSISTLWAANRSPDSAER